MWFGGYCYVSVMCVVWWVLLCECDVCGLVGIAM